LIGFCPPINSKADKVDEYVLTRMRELHVPGLSLAIDRDGQVAKARGYGFANLELQAKATPDTVYEIGSTTK
jgi:CubicO group peptidase (beta-lactamase class C family)